MSTVLERALEARVVQLEAENAALQGRKAAPYRYLTEQNIEDIKLLVETTIDEGYLPMGTDAVEAAERLSDLAPCWLPSDERREQRRTENRIEELADAAAAAYHAGIDALAYQLGTHIDADIVKCVHDSAPYGDEHRKKHLDLSERVKQLEGELRHYRGEVPPMLAPPQLAPVASSLPFEATPHVTEPVAPAPFRLNEIQKREFLIANGWTVHPEVEDQNIRVCWENGGKWLTLDAAYDLVVAEQKKARLRAAGWESVVDPVDEIERWRRPSDGELVMFHLAEAP